MIRLSQTAWDIIAALHRRPTLLGRLGGRSANDVALLEQLLIQPEPSVIPQLAHFVFSPNERVRRAAAAVARAALAHASDGDLLELDDACRRESVEHWSHSPWVHLRALDVSRLERLDGDEIGPIAIASFHRDGYVREAAVARLDSLNSEMALPLLLIRLNDWVQPVADRAKISVERRLTDDNASAFFEHISLVERLHGHRRRDHSSILAAVDALFQRPSQRALLLEGLRSPRRDTRRRCFRWIIAAAEDAGRAELIMRGLADADTVIRMRAIEAARALQLPDVEHVIVTGLADPFPHVRREALGLVADKVPAQADRLVRAALMDTNPGVREVARFLVRRRSDRLDLVAAYRENLGSVRPRDVAVAVAGIGETGSATDAAVIVPMLSHEHPMVREAAVRAIGTLDLAGPLPALLDALQDPSPRVSAAAREGLRSRVSEIVIPLRQILRDSRHPHARRHALSLLAMLGKWQRLPFLLEATSDADIATRRLANLRVASWITHQNRSMAQPTRPELEAIRAALESRVSTLPAPVVREVWSILRFWSG